MPVALAVRLIAFCTIRDTFRTTAALVVLLCNDACGGEP